MTKNDAINHREYWFLENNYNFETILRSLEKYLMWIFKWEKKVQAGFYILQYFSTKKMYSIFLIKVSININIFIHSSILLWHGTDI